MDPQNKTKRLYVVTIVIFILIVLLGHMAHLWRGDDYKFLLLLFVLISIALRLDEIFNALSTDKTKSSDMYLLDTRLQNIIESLENLNRNVAKFAYRQPDQPAAKPETENEHDLY